MTKTSEIAYHFVGEKLRDGRDIPEDGVKLVHDGELKLCSSGLHASLHPFDALRYAPGFTLCKVLCEGEIIHGDDKLVCSERTILQRIDATEMVRKFVRDAALDVVHLWCAPDVVIEFLKTGDEKLRKAARKAASAAVYAASAAYGAYGASNVSAYASASASAYAAYASVYAASASATYGASAASHASAASAYDAAAYSAYTIEKYKEKFVKLVEAEFEN